MGREINEGRDTTDREDSTRSRRTPHPAQHSTHTHKGSSHIALTTDYNTPTTQQLGSHARSTEQSTGCHTRAAHIGKRTTDCDRDVLAANTTTPHNQPHRTTIRANVTSGGSFMSCHHIAPHSSITSTSSIPSTHLHNRPSIPPSFPPSLPLSALPYHRLAQHTSRSNSHHTLSPTVPSFVLASSCVPHSPLLSSSSPSSPSSFPLTSPPSRPLLRL